MTRRQLSFSTSALIIVYLHDAYHYCANSSYVLDYLQRAGFLSTAAAFLSENPSISLHSADSGRVFPSNSSKNASSSIRSYTTSPTSISNPSSRTSPTSLPLFRSESGSSPISPTQQDAQNHSTVESTSSTSSTSTFGFERTKGNGTDDEFPSPGDEKREETKANRQRTIPAANVEYEVESGYLYECVDFLVLSPPQPIAYLVSVR